MGRLRAMLPPISFLDSHKPSRRRGPRSGDARLSGATASLCSTNGRCEAGLLIGGAADFRFWAVALIRHTGYFKLSSLWFLRPRGFGTGLRRWREFVDIIHSSIRGDAFL